MKFINVLKSFKLNQSEGVLREFEVGLHEVEDDIAAHWYVAANSEPLTAKQAKALQVDAPADPVPDATDTPAADTPPADQPA